MGPDEDHGHARQMCCRQASGDTCAVWAPCYNDNGLGFDRADAVEFDEPLARSRNGLIDANIDQIKFGVMFSDGELDRRRNRDGHYSYGPENKALPNGQGINVGARRPGAVGNLHVGALIAPGKWFYDNGNLSALDVTDDVERVRSHNKVVQQVVGRLVPHGTSPLSAFVHDAEEFYKNDNAQCRERSVIFVTRGFDAVLANGREPGFPYEPAADYARRLRALGVTLHVVLIAPEGENGNVAWGQQLASAGGGQFAAAQTAETIRVAISKATR